MTVDEPLRVGLVGSGSMGSLHARVVAGSTECSLAWVAEPDRERGERVAARFETRWIPEPDLASVDAVVIAAPTESHFDLAIPVIEARVPLLLEKPLADRVEHSRRLVDAARASRSVLMCGLLERFNPAIRTAIEIAREPLYVATQRHSPYVERIRTGVAGDLLSHDVDMVIRIFGGLPLRVSGRCGYFEPRSEPGSEDLVDATLTFDDGRMASLSASRVSQRKVRSLVITELTRLIEVDLLRQAITVYRHVDAPDFDEDAGYSHQAIIDIPVLKYLGEPLQLQLAHFVDLVRGRADAAVELDSMLDSHEVVASILADAREDGRTSENSQ